MQKWEYLFIEASWEKRIIRPRYHNNKEIPDWKSLPEIHEYLNQLGTEGWELVNTTFEEGNVNPRFAFKRPME
jgi:hypothetical protein